MLSFFLIAFALAVTISHARALRHVQALVTAPREVRLRLWQTHERWNGVLWVVLFFTIVAAEFFFPRGSASPRPSVGVPLFLVGFLLVVWSRRILGRRGAMGVRWFFPEDAFAWEDRGPYRFLGNPMYDGFLLMLLGLGVSFGTPQNFFLALASFFLLNVYLANVESYGMKNRIV